jgi:outer membrane protein TolC
MTRSSLAVLALSLALPGAAFAQAPSPVPPSGSASGLPGLPPVTDPMLAPVPSPKRTLESWDEAVGYLRGRSTNLKIAVDQVLQAEAQTTIALAQYLPSLGGCSGSTGVSGCANGAYTHQLITNAAPTQTIAGQPVLTGNAISNRVPVVDTFASTVTLSQDIINFQEFDQIGINKIMERATHQTVDDTKRTLELSLATQVVTVVTAERTAEINRVGLKVALEQLELTRKKAADGAATGLDIVRAQQNAANARASLVAGDEALRQAREALGLALGIPEETGVSAALRIDGFASDALRACHAVSDVDERPDIAAARTNLEVAKRNLRNTWFSFLPTLGGSAQMSVTSVPPQGYPNPTVSIGAVLTVPIWDGGTRIGNVKNMRAMEDIALQTLDGLKRAAIIQVEQAQRGIEVAETSARVAQEQRDLAAQNDQMTQTAWMHGQGTSVDLVTASEAHRQAELTLALAEFNVVKARLAANLALATCPW